MDKKDVVVLTLIFLLSFFVWTLPIQQNQLPFGEGDGAYHYAYNEYMASADKTMTTLPDYIYFWYYGYNTLVPASPEYPPSNHVAAAIVQVFAGGIVPVFIFYALTCSFGALALYFLIRKLFGFLPATLASFLMVFSNREIMLYLFGQRPTVTAFVVIPVLLYAYHKYFSSLFEKPETKYLYVVALILAAQFLLHLQGLLVSVFILIVYSLMMILKHKALPKLQFRHLGISFLVILLLCAWFLPIYLGESEGQTDKDAVRDFSKLFKWGVSPESVAGAFPAGFVLFSSQYGSGWIAVLILLGILYLAFKRDNKSILLLGWLIAVYILFHLDFFMGVYVSRVARMLIAEPMLFFSLIALGVFSVTRFIKLKTETRSIANVALLVVFVVVFGFLIAEPAYLMLESAYYGPFRMTEPQKEVAGWMAEELPDNAFVYTLGTATYPKARWMLALSHRYVDRFNWRIEDDTIVVSSSFWHFLPEQNLSYYLLFDYSDAAAFNADASSVRQFEQTHFGDKTPLYDNKNVKVYYFGKNIKIELEQ